MSKILSSEELKELSINDIITYYGIKIVSAPDGKYKSFEEMKAVYWEYNNKRIPRPDFKSCYIVCKECFGLDIDALKIKEYYQNLGEKSNYNKYKI